VFEMLNTAGISIKSMRPKSNRLEQLMMSKLQEAD